MSAFSVPLSSSPPVPSTPDSGQRYNGVFSKSSSKYAANPSTTPAGPPPSSIGSFTPADPPPSSIFGSSQLGSGKTLFKSKSSSGASKASRQNVNPFSNNTIDESKLARFLDKTGQIDFTDSNGATKTTGKTFGLPSSNALSRSVNESEDDSYEYEEEEFDENDTEGVDNQEGDTDSNVGLEARNSMLWSGVTTTSAPNDSSIHQRSHGLGSSIMENTPRSRKRSRLSALMPSPISHVPPKQRKPKQDSAIPSIAKGMARQLGVAGLDESDDFILRIEDIIQQELYGSETLGETHEQVLKAGLSAATERLNKFWRSYRDQENASLPLRQSVIHGIGPEDGVPVVQEAIFLGTLLLQLHHPPAAKGKQALAVTRLNQSSRLSKSSSVPQMLSNPTALPKILIDWLDQNHNNYQPMFAEVQKHQPNATAHYNYWDVVFAFALRAKIADLVRLLEVSNFQRAKTARQDGQGHNSYHPKEVQSIERVVNGAIEVLRQCPGLLNDDWNIPGREWIRFRKRVEQAIYDLETFSEGGDRDLRNSQSDFEATTFGIQGTTMNLSDSTRKAESRVPWTIYQSLKAMYKILLGGTTEILSYAQDWVEATIGLTIWWNGDEDEDFAVSSLALTRRSLGQSRSRGPPLVDVNESAAYQRKLAQAFERVTEDSESSDEDVFQINSMKPVEIGLASIFEGNVEGVIGLLKGRSLPVASAVSEIASAGGWFNSSAVSSVEVGLDESDLLMLSTYNDQGMSTLGQERPLTNDSILVDYANALSERDRLHRQRGSQDVEGWELSMSILTRLDDEDLAAQRVRDLLDRISLDSDARMDKVLHTCDIYGMGKEAHSITEGYANKVLSNSDNYGTALIYYSRAHSKKRVKEVLDILMSLSLVESLACPPPSALDSNLRILLFSPKESLGQLALVDPEAAEILQSCIPGYATLRKFYDLRDEEENLEQGHKPKLRPIARKAAAATALLAVIGSAADNITGGLYDEGRGAAVQVDGLLALLGEAMVFINQPKSLLSSAQCFTILKAIEDLQTVSVRIYNQCEEFLASTLAACQGHAAPPSPRNLMYKMTSSMTSASSFSLVGSSILNSEVNSHTSDSGALIKSQDQPKRSWDWRTGLARDVKGEDILRILRLGLARDIARHWVESEGI